MLARVRAHNLTMRNLFIAAAAIAIALVLGVLSLLIGSVALHWVMDERRMTPIGLIGPLAALLATGAALLRRSSSRRATSAQILPPVGN